MASHRLDVLGFGAVAIDDIVYVDRPLKAGKGKVVGRTRDFGGNVATALVAVARLGGRAGFIGWLSGASDDDPSAGELERQGVDVSRAPRRPDARAIRSVITVGPDGDRFIAYDDDVPHGTRDDLSDQTLSAARVLLIDGYATHSERIVARARALGLSVVADIEWSIGSATDRLIALADHLVLPLAYAEAQTGETAPAAILQRLWTDDRAAVVLTDGDRGAFVRLAGDARDWHVPAYAVHAVDTTGAGDCFHGAYALALSRGEPPIDCVRYAAAAAAISVTGKGGRMALPDHAACNALMTATDAPRPLAMA
ncbi:permease [Rhizobium sp. Leaf371]|uniref:PfkB family carbohydrate kinase n=1 Tax=Rhizobium sp. Leaf371 TaxID=1736355 RepID=UPI000715742B|nr:PfkB family carbohydrate kinase [Rhizobium sp. Leaf371]KQS71632.1 permease [Rhizobium sp. Leaf371]